MFNVGLLCLVLHLSVDLELDSSACVAALSGAAADMSVMFRMSTLWPCAALGAWYIPEGCAAACMVFSTLPTDILGASFGSTCRQAVSKAGAGTMQQAQNLANAPVQHENDVVFQASWAFALLVERGFVATKQNDPPSLCRLSTPGRGQFLHQHHRQRETRMCEAWAAFPALRKPLSASLQSLAWQLHSESRQRHSRGGVPRPCETAVPRRGMRWKRNLGAATQLRGRPSTGPVWPRPRPPAALVFRRIEGHSLGELDSSGAPWSTRSAFALASAFAGQFVAGSEKPFGGALRLLPNWPRCLSLRHAGLHRRSRRLAGNLRLPVPRA